MKRKILSAMIAVIMIIGVIPAVSAADVPESVEEPSVAAEPTIADETAAQEPSEAEEIEEVEPVKPDADLAVTEANSIPKITRVNPSANGLTVRWTAFDGAAKYMVFTEKPGGGWKKIGESTSLSFEHKNLTNNTAYKYTVRAADKNGKFVSGYDKTGYTFTYLTAPTLTSVQNTYDGQRVSWHAVEGASVYLVYVGSSSGWQEIGLTASTNYRYTEVVSGKKYSYTVRCWDPEKRTVQSFYNRSGVSGVYVESPQIIGFTPAKGGVTLKWSASAGAPRYSVFMKSSGKWKKLCNTEGTSYTHTGLTDNTVYVYTVRCINKNGEFISGYNSAGEEWIFLTPPQITGVENYVIGWQAKEQAAAYRIYRKPFNGAWECIGRSETNSFTDTTAAQDTLYAYTVRALDAEGSLITHFNADDTYYYNGNPANGKINSLYFVDGKVRQGYVTVDGKMYYYNSKGVLQKNGLVGSSKEGWRYADKDGVVQLKYTGLASNSAGTWYVKNGTLDRTLRTAVTVGGVNYIVINGKATKVTTEKDLTLFRAFKLIEKATTSSMSRSEKLRACFDYIIDITTEKNPRIPDTHDEGWPELYANDIFVNQTGNCFSYASSFAYCAKALGYTNIYVCNNEFHGWAEINGLVYDPQQSKYYTTQFFGLSYSDSIISGYASTIDTDVWWMYVKIA